jgi:hypothetical protein
MKAVTIIIKTTYKSILFPIIHRTDFHNI